MKAPRRRCVGHIGEVADFYREHSLDDTPYKVVFREIRLGWFSHSELAHAPKKRKKEVTHG